MDITQFGATSLVKPGSISYSVTPDRGPWTYLASTSTIKILNGNIFISDSMSTITITNLGMDIGINKYIILEISIENGIPKSAELKSGSSLPEYRTFGDEKSINGQKTLSAVILALGDDIGSFISDTVQYNVYKCVYSDLMIYANCDGLILLPAPFSLPPSSTLKKEVE